jgi:phosphate transport system permease protein
VVEDYRGSLYSTQKDLTLKIKPQQNLLTRKIQGWLFNLSSVLCLLIGLGALVVLLVEIGWKGIGWLNWQFLTNFDSRFADRAGILAALAGTAYLMVLVIIITVPIGVATAIYLEEYGSQNWFKWFIKVSIGNLAGVPAIVFGLLGLQVFVRFFGLGRSILAGAFTMSLLVLPFMIIAAQEAIRAVPSTIRDAAYALGSTKWQVIRHHVLPGAFSGILTGNILATSRAIGEAAPLITIGALTFVPFLPESPLDRFTVIPIQIFNWTSKPQEEFQNVAATAIIVLLIFLLLLNSLAAYFRQRLRVKYY